jgi:hypothetical protein
MRAQSSYDTPTALHTPTPSRALASAAVAKWEESAETGILGCQDVGYKPLVLEGCPTSLHPTQPWSGPACEATPAVCSDADAPLGSDGFFNSSSMADPNCGPGSLTIDTTAGFLDTTTSSSPLPASRFSPDTASSTSTSSVAFQCIESEAEMAQQESQSPTLTNWKMADNCRLGHEVNGRPASARM